jgi:NAD(P)-dependent dehydrogenase (short-subunit alcohol dehydrogenase family)
MSKLTDKVAVVTGASKGIGAAIARSLAAEGASVVVNYASSKAGADTVVAAIKAAGGKAVLYAHGISPDPLGHLQSGASRSSSRLGATRRQPQYGSFAGFRGLSLRATRLFARRGAPFFSGR